MLIKMPLFYIASYVSHKKCLKKENLLYSTSFIIKIMDIFLNPSCDSSVGAFLFHNI